MSEMIDQREIMIIRQVAVKATAELFSMRDFTQAELIQTCKLFEKYILNGE